MSKWSNKIGVFIILMTCFSFITACASNKNTNEPTVIENTTNENTSSDVNEQENENIRSNFEETLEEKEITSEFVRSETEINSIFYRSSKDIGSDISKEVKETLSEFNATASEGGTKLTLPDDILFDFDSADLRPESDKVINQLEEVIGTTDGDVTIIGHTDNRGQDDYNQKLSEERADAVRIALIDAGVEKARIKAKGKGASEPVASNTNSDGSDNPDGRQKNRRVEMIIQGFND